MFETIYSSDLKKLAVFKNVTHDQLESMTLADINAGLKAMVNAEFGQECERNKSSEEFARLVEKYFTPFKMLLKYWSKNEIIEACALAGINEYQLCEKKMIRPGHLCHDTDAEYIRTSREHMPEYDHNGRQYLEGKYEICDVYRVRNHYQGIYHGDVIKSLLYGRYPELKKFCFKFYEYYAYSNTPEYEIYPDCKLYVPFEALMEGNIEKVLERNREYCKSYNHGEYTPERLEARLLYDPATKELIEAIKAIGEKGHIKCQN